ncbi:chemotaxis protein MotC [Shinella sp. 838]|jgi:chemotaxis protein MotC|uniref:chemotaxis protein MotC n=1 Tax=unclassified Shinella TaxID=2643062 RepID=UPI0003C563CF|nr:MULTISPECIES: chemotaxis protein MotC [unclassified Shinella]EYR80385.1 chemotaxis protein MotC [Shinella sp. DD12]MCA0342377.1 chemotaxis protein [Pseudomonadota bacterium]MDG4672258.1 chemotaxis protein MotC [Shinella sp. 838]
MGFLRRFLLTGTVLCAALSAVAPARAEDLDDLAPYKMIRSLQYVQDTVALGDHSAMEMQRFLLSTIDERLRTGESALFDDPRNVDAALVYAMSGGNPETLEVLIKKDVDGHFDSRLTDALRSYLSGRGTQSVKSLAEIFPEYKRSRVGPYLALVSANSVMRKDPALALTYFDWARLVAPGTIVEEAALRRSIYIASEAGWIDKSMAYANRYARRYLRSPYASQFADLFVKLAVDHFEAIKEDDILEILSFMDVPRQREVYLRMARLAAISGKNKLASLAAERAQVLSGDGESVPKVLADLYSGLASVPSGDVAEAMESIIAIPDDKLSTKDRALKAAARAVAEEVLREPAVSVAAETQTETDLAKPVQQAEDASSDGLSEAELADRAMDPRAGGEETPVAAAVEPQQEKKEQPESAGIDPAFDTFVSGGRSKLDEIDALLKGEGS